MRRLAPGVLTLVTCAALIGAAQAQVLWPPRMAGAASPIPSFLHKTTGISLPSRVLPAACSPDAVGATCGYVKVPLDRANPDAGKIEIYFELYPHSNPGPAESAIIGNAGGPGPSTTSLRGIYLALFGANLDAHDLLLIDDRGRGLSTTIVCPELQHGTAPFSAAEADCAAQLGTAASRYGTGDIALDIDDVRAALHYDLVDYAVPSYGGIDASAYATRFGSHLRSVVLDSPVGTPGLQAFSIEQLITRAIPRMMRLLCARSPTCSADQSNPDANLNRLISAIREQPIEGDAHDANGRLVHVRVDETTLLWLMFEPNGFFVDIGELLAASNALERGDTLPLLRIAAEEFIPLVSDYGDPTLQSSGAQFATQCADAEEPWDWNAPIFAREAQFLRAAADLPVDAFAPFSKEAATNLQFSTERQCIWWQRPTPFARVVPTRATYPSTPTLVLAGDLDTTVTPQEARQVAALFPNSTFVSVAEAGHGSVTFSQCAQALASEFIETLEVGDTSCTQTPETVWPALGRFPLFARDARAADTDPNGTNQIGVPERKVVTVAVAAAVDALKRSSIGGGDGVGLRDGTFHTDFGDTGWTITLSRCAFAQDISVSGTIIWGADLSFSADLAVSGPGTSGGNLHVQGTWQAPGPVGRFRISGKLGGQNVAVFVPEA